MLIKWWFCFWLSISWAFGQAAQQTNVQNKVEFLSATMHIAELTKSKSAISFGLGLNYSLFKNETVSLLTNKGLGIPIALAYRRESIYTKQYIQLSVLSHNLNSPFGNLTHELRGSLSYTYLRRLNHWESMNFYVGAELLLQASYRNNPFQSLPANNEDYALINSLNPSILMDYVIQNHKLEGQFVITGVGYNIRSASNFYSGINDSSFRSIVSAGKCETLPDFLNAYLRLSYFPPSIFRHTYWRIDYTGNLQQFRQQQYTGIVQHQLIASITYQF